MRAIDAYEESSEITHLALKWSALTFCPPGEVRRAEWTEIDWDNRLNDRAKYRENASSRRSYPYDPRHPCAPGFLRVNGPIPPFTELPVYVTFVIA